MYSYSGSDDEYNWSHLSSSLSSFEIVFVTADFFTYHSKTTNGTGHINYDWGSISITTDALACQVN